MIQPSPHLEADVLTSAERWQRWEARGQANDARFMRRAHRLFWLAAVVIVAISLWARLH